MDEPVVRKRWGRAGAESKRGRIVCGCLRHCLQIIVGFLNIDSRLRIIEEDRKQLFRQAKGHYLPGESTSKVTANRGITY
ncbi:hypothetical protein MJO29_016462 [Puccinia striiformis f. sp. tritici]|nr:hypothetical protein MJO29_016462 [Puccinia striiformis f. sp. tritici]